VNRTEWFVVVLNRGLAVRLFAFVWEDVEKRFLKREPLIPKPVHMRIKRQATLTSVLTILLFEVPPEHDH
jgi:hypothetical protein